MNINKNVSVWRGDYAPPTIYHLWIKSDGTQYIHNGEAWVSAIQIPVATETSDGLMSKEDKKSLNEMSDYMTDEDVQSLFNNIYSI